MEVKWTRLALFDLVRFYDFLLPLTERATSRIIQALTNAPNRLLEHPRLGERLDEFEPREIRRIFINNYEMRYELQESWIFILRFWHARERR